MGYLVCASNISRFEDGYNYMFSQTLEEMVKDTKSLIDDGLEIQFCGKIEVLERYENKIDDMILELEDEDEE